ncbi:MAG: hypothetical protein QM791_13100 [Ferruginibacter sp.]
MSQRITGNYALRGVQDMAAGFQFQADSFKFYCYYGAVDRFAEGTFTINGDTIVLKSSKEPGKDFTILKKEKAPTQFTVKVIEPNEFLAKYVMAIVVTGEKQEAFYPGKDGLIKVEAGNTSKIYLKHELYPDIPTLIRDENEDFTYVEVKLNESLQQLSFKGIDLFIKEDDELTWYPNYFIAAQNVRFIKGD